jgi:predicted MFS family arabinose efflux permease
MTTGDALLLILGLAAGTVAPSYGWLLPLWLALGVGYSLVLTPCGRLLRRSARPDDRPALFAAQFALSHACWLVTCPLAGMLGATAGLPVTFAVLGGGAFLGSLAALALWPADDTDAFEHDHQGLPVDHPHLADTTGGSHLHAVMIDADHPTWSDRR